MKPDKTTTTRGAGALVFAGGALGAFLRWAFTVDTGIEGSLWPLLVVNLTGAFALGLMVGYLPLVSDTTGSGKSGRRERIRLTFGTGLLGGFTSYSAIAAATVQDAGGPLGPIVYLVGTVVLGLLLAKAGLWCGARITGEPYGRDNAGSGNSGNSNGATGEATV
ncbi:MAG TPA: CrcB family protein [Candidatus Corynebacterium avicola]|uniref:Fluoride-specific ion channel FluC n=1 Tax=Candidatus Corynebacterium avicola TaxID=2838527 RepID=A0A9D1UM58_9CORY|nr:CrcB family protein [Candidatus Corynebacterium avicola]